jgi:hypothetical protein
MKILYNFIMKINHCLILFKISIIDKKSHCKEDINIQFIFPY